MLPLDSFCISFFQFSGPKTSSGDILDLYSKKDENVINLAETNFKIQAYQAAARYNLNDLYIDSFMDNTGIDTIMSSGYEHRGTPNFDVIVNTAWKRKIHRYAKAEIISTLEQQDNRIKQYEEDLQNAKDKIGTLEGIIKLNKKNALKIIGDIELRKGEE